MPLVTFTVTRDAGYENYIDFVSQTGAPSFTMVPNPGTVQQNLPEGTTYTLSGRSNQSTTISWQQQGSQQVGLEDGGGEDYNDLQVSVDIGEFNSISGNQVTYTSSAVSIFTFTVDKNNIQLGQSVVFTWTSTGGTTANINTSPVNPNFGTLYVTPLSTAVNGSWVLRVENGLGQFDTAVVFITVTSPAPTISSFTASPTSIVNGSSSTLTWSYTNGTSASINQGVGVVTLSPNSKSVTPTIDTIYTLTVTGPGGTVSTPVTVTVNQIPAVTLTTPVDVLYGSQTRIDYTAQSCDISLSITPTYNYDTGSVIGAAVTIPPSASTITGFINTVIPYTTSGPRSVSYRIAGVGSGGPAAITKPINVIIDEQPDLFDIPSSVGLTPNQINVITPDPLGLIPIPILTILGVDIPVEITANAPIQISINGGNWLDIRQSP